MPQVSSIVYPSKEMQDSIDRDLVDALTKIKEYNKEHNIKEESSPKPKRVKIQRKKFNMAVGKALKGLNLPGLELTNDLEEEIKRQKFEQECIKYNEERFRKEREAEKKLKRLKIYGRL